jgi:hypothetical protein
MAKFQVLASERVFYEVEVEAKDRAELDELLSQGDISWCEPIDGNDFCVDYIEELKED